MPYDINGRPIEDEDPEWDAINAVCIAIASFLAIALICSWL